MAEHIRDGTGSGGMWAVSIFNAGKVFLSDSLGSAIGSTNPLPFQVENPSSFQIIRLLVGSPPSTFVFSSISESFLIENLGSPQSFFNFDTTATTGSNVGIIREHSAKSFDLKIGSVSIWIQQPAIGSEFHDVQIISVR